MNGNRLYDRVPRPCYVPPDTVPMRLRRWLRGRIKRLSRSAAVRLFTPAKWSFIAAAVAFVCATLWLVK